MFKNHNQHFSIALTVSYSIIPDNSADRKYRWEVFFYWVFLISFLGNTWWYWPHYHICQRKVNQWIYQSIHEPSHVAIMIILLAHQTGTMSFSIDVLRHFPPALFYFLKDKCPRNTVSWSAAKKRVNTREGHFLLGTFNPFSGIIWYHPAFLLQ